jgi:hypothetical protein
MMVTTTIPRVEQITRCPQGSQSSFCHHFHNAFGFTRLALNDEHDFTSLLFLSWNSTDLALGDLGQL